MYKYRKSLIFTDTGRTVRSAMLSERSLRSGS